MPSRPSPHYPRIQSMMEITDGFTQDSVDFLEWLKEQPGVTVSPKINIADFRTRGAGRGIIALEDISQDEELFSIPYTSVLSIYSSDLEKGIRDELVEMEPWLSLVLVMIFEFGQGRASRWWPYLKLLPSQFDTLMYWSDAELRELEGSAIRRKISKDGANVAFVDILLPILMTHASLFGEYEALIKGPNAKEDFLPLAHRMASLVMAYAFDLEKENREEEVDEEGFISDDEDDRPKGLVLLADMLNAEGDNNNARLFHNDTCLTMTSQKPIGMGQEIFNTYGEIPRADLLRRYGYVSNNYKSWDVVEIDSGMILEVVKIQTNLNNAQIAKRTELLQEWDVWEESYDLNRQSGNTTGPYDGFDPSLLITLRVFTIEVADIERLRLARKPLKPAIDMMTLTLLQEVIRHRQREYTQSIAQDVEALQGNVILGRHRMAIEVRLGEKEILASASEYVNQKKREISTGSIPDNAIKHASVTDSHRAKRLRKE